jgi:acetyltransferase
VIGASSRPGTLSWWPLRHLTTKGFDGPVYPVNPSREQIEGLTCYPSVAALPQVPDVAVVALDAERTLEAVRECAAAGVGAVVLPTQGFGELGEAGQERAEELASLGGPGRLRIVGPNTDGVGNLASGAIASIQPLLAQDIPLGPVAVVTQSGATAGSLIARLMHEGIGARMYASTGNEADLGFADYLSVMVQDPNVAIVLSFVEAIRRPEHFVGVATLAAELRKPIVLIKVGRSEQGARRAAAHTGALAGQDALYDAIFEDLGVIRVEELSELVAVTKLFLSRGAPAGRGVGILSVSGGQAGAVADRVVRCGLSVPDIAADTERALDEVLEFGTGFNPCDLTGAVATDPTLATRVFGAFDREPAIHTVIYARKALTGEAGSLAAQQLAAAAGPPAATPLTVYAMDGGVDGAEATHYRDHAIPVFASVAELATAIAGLARWRERCEHGGERREGAARGRIGAGGVLEDESAKQLLGAYGLQLPREIAVDADPDAARAAAEQLGYPVVLKVRDSRIAHKTEAGGVLVGLRDGDAVRDGAVAVLEGARRHLADGTAAEGLLVQEQVEGGCELILGVKVDPGFGPFILVGMGGVLTEVLADVALRPAPVSAQSAAEMLDQLRGSALLRGFRGAPPADIGAAVEAIVGLSQLAWDHREHLSEIDLNPLVVLSEGAGARVLDALVIEREEHER